jgi:TRAP-type C4-dicarboxylate transport system substrate-binding protein
MKQITLNWVIAHEPVDLFLAAAERFSAEIFEKTSGMYKVEISTLSEYNKKNQKTLKTHELVEVMGDEIDLCQMYTYILGNYNKDLWTIDMPFIFKDHNHVDRVFEGPIGKSMLDRLAEKSSVRGLAFTYSGGYKCIPSNVELRTVEDFKGTRIRTSNNPVSHDIFKSLGAEPVDMPIERLAQAGHDGSVDGGESTFIRIFASGQDKAFNTVCELDHSLLATTIIVSNSFWNSLTDEVKEIFQTAALNTARHERRESVADVDKQKQKCLDANMEIIKLSEEEIGKMRSATQNLYSKYDSFFEYDLLNQIKNA